MLLFVLVILLSCQFNKSSQAAHSEKRTLSKEFKDYWYAGQAEITSYALEQPRYGEMRKGSAVLIFVTEDFLPNEQVKADSQKPDNVPVLKLNTTKKYNTGIYPYSIMTSIFYPVSEKRHAIKVSNSVQEWCGQAYAQLNNRVQFKYALHSYFEGEADREVTLQPNILEDELWTQLRVDPRSLPTGENMVIPAMEFARLKHIDFKAYPADLTKTDTSYTIAYQNLDRKLTIFHQAKFPFKITSWEETFNSGGKQMTSKATLQKTLKTAYWQQNAEQYSGLRDSLQLD